MKKKIITVVVMVTTIISAFACMGCDSFNLAEYRESGKESIQTYAESKVCEIDFTEEELQVIEEVVILGTDAINTADSKSAVDEVVRAALAIIDKVKIEEITVDGVSNLFDLTEPKECYPVSIYLDFYDDAVVVVLKISTVYPELPLAAFGLENAESLHYSSLAPIEEHPTFHQILTISLKNKGKTHVMLALYQLNKLDFVKAAEPRYIHTVQYD